MSRILIWKNVEPGSACDIFRKLSYDAQKEVILQDPNVNNGNRLWFQGLISEIQTNENQYDYLTASMSPQYINDNYEMIIYPMANIFNEEYKKNLEELAVYFSKIRIPTFVIACGAQAESYNALGELVYKIGESSKKFISAVYDTGGEFALRGHFTKRFFEKLGFDTAVVTGCPSMYQLGRNFKAVYKEKENVLCPVFHGNMKAIEKMLVEYPESVYIDQSVFFDALYGVHTGRISFREAYRFYSNCGELAAELLSENRIYNFWDMHDWRTYLMSGRFNYSFGSRIHGSIMAILSGLPATVVAVDSRTKEMAEFFDIPYVETTQTADIDLCKCYEEADYTQFNANYKNRYDQYEKFLRDHKIVKKINDNNIFFDNDIEYITAKPLNSEYYDRMKRKIAREKFLYKCILKVKNPI